MTTRILLKYCSLQDSVKFTSTTGLVQLKSLFAAEKEPVFTLQGEE